MSALAEPAIEAVTSDNLARRNALVLSVAQALAGGNNTVLVATAGIVGTMLAPERGSRPCRSASSCSACG